MRTSKRIQQRLYIASEMITFRVIERDILFCRCMQIQRKGFAVWQCQLPDAADAFRLRAEQLIKLKHPAYVATARRLTGTNENHVRGNGDADDEV